MRAARECRQPLFLVPVIVAAFPTMHVAYAIGMVAGFWRALLRPREVPAVR